MTIASAALLLFLILDPLGNIPVFLSLLRTLPPKRQRVVLAREMLIALGVLMLFLWGGRYALDLMHLRQESVSIAGGIVLFLMLGLWRAPAWKSALSGLVTALIVAIAVYGMPVQLAVISTLYGAAYGLFPIAWISSSTRRMRSFIRRVTSATSDGSSYRMIQSGVSTARSISVLTAVWLAISPATSPPIPSAITTA